MSKVQGCLSFESSPHLPRARSDPDSAAPIPAPAPRKWQNHPECVVIPVGVCPEALCRAFPWHRLSAPTTCLSFNTEQGPSWERAHSSHSSLHEFQSHFISLGLARKFKGKRQSSCPRSQLQITVSLSADSISLLLPLFTICFHDHNMVY